MATETKRVAHTPGPWEVCDDPDGVYIYLGGRPTENIVCDIIGRVYDEEARVSVIKSEDLANARLIAAAPAQSLILDMLALSIARLERSGPLVEFCFDGLRYVATDRDWREIIHVIGWDRARAAIDKAEGKQ